MAEKVPTGVTAGNCNVARLADVPVLKDAIAFHNGKPGGLLCFDPDDQHPNPWVDQDSYTQASYIRSNTNGQDVDVHIGGRGGDLCVPYHDSGAAAAINTKPCVPRFAEDLSTADAGLQIDHVVNGAGTALYQPPKDVTIRVTDNDMIVQQAQASIDGCRSTTLFQYAQADPGTDSIGQQNTQQPGNGVFKTQWLTDYNCKSGDLGGLPGYPVEVASTGIDGYCTDSSLTSKADCTSTTEAGCASANNGCSTANKYCSVAGKCFWGSDPTGAVASLYAARTSCCIRVTACALPGCRAAPLGVVR